MAAELAITNFVPNGVDLIQEELREMERSRRHPTAGKAGKVAEEAGCRLLIAHDSIFGADTPTLG